MSSLFRFVCTLIYMIFMIIVLKKDIHGKDRMLCGTKSC